jgi:hypothetical protein
MRRSFSNAARKHGYRSGLEIQISKQIKEKGLAVNYEDPNARISFVQPAMDRNYTPDFVLPNGVIIETKGRFTLEDRKKHLWIQEQCGTKYDIRFVFSNSRAKIRKGSKTSYADWCEKHGFLYADQYIPEEWFHENKRQRK